jgi:hypothetical protein
MLLSGELVRGSLGTTDALSAQIEDLQYTLGEGPGIDAHHDGRAIVEPDLARPELDRWQAFTPPVLEAGARAVFAFPVRIGSARLGALNLYRRYTGPLDGEQFADALVLADVAARTILATQANAPPGAVAAELEAGANFHYVVHQAAGMAAIQLDVGVTEALVRLRAYAFGADRLLADVARDVVARRLRLSGADSQ